MLTNAMNGYMICILFSSVHLWTRSNLFIPLITQNNLEMVEYSCQLCFKNQSNNKNNLDDW